MSEEEAYKIFSEMTPDVLDYVFCLAKAYTEKDKEIEKLNNIIKEVREYLTDEGVCILNKGMKENERLVWTWENYYDLLEILGRENNDK